MNAALYIFGSGMGFGLLLAILLGWSYIALEREQHLRLAQKPELEEELKKLRAFHALHINKHD